MTDLSTSPYGPADRLLAPGIAARKRRLISRGALTRLTEQASIYLYLLLICIFVLAPVLIVVAISFNDKRYLVFPIETYSLRWWTEVIVRPEWGDAIMTSVMLAVQATIISTIIGVSAGLAIHYHNFKGRDLLGVFFTSPLLMPQLLTGLALLYFFGQAGISGTYNALLLGHVLVGFPYMVRLVLAALPNVSRTVEEAAMTLGANEFKTLVQITLPLIAPAIRGGAMFAFIASYNNVLMSLFLSVARTTPVPIKIYQYIEWGADPTVAAVSTFFLAVTFIVLLVVRKAIGLEIMPNIEHNSN